MKKQLFLLLMAASVAVPLPSRSQPQPGASLPERYSYAMGVRLGQALKAQGVRELDSAALAAAIDDVISGRGARMSEAEMAAVVREQRVARAQASLAAGRDFLAGNASRPGVTVLPSGLQYRVIETGNGPRPGSDDTVRVHYHGTRIDGSVFDSSVERGQPAEFPLTGVIPGFREGISLMSVGSHWQLAVPSELAYGERGAGADIGPNETLLFEIQLLDIVR
jgi:FKBP-type peptidyl-prolyl cis-trans isomerase FklB